MSENLLPSTPSATPSLPVMGGGGAATNPLPVIPASQPGVPGNNPSSWVGLRGASAYEVAVANGFEGDEVAWLASLVGTGGPGGSGPTEHTETIVTMDPLFSGSNVREGLYETTNGWRELVIFVNVSSQYASAGSIKAALQIKTAAGVGIIPWAIPVEASDPFSGTDQRVTVIRLQRVLGSILLDVYMGNLSYEQIQALSEMNAAYQQSTFADYMLGDGSGGGYGGGGYGSYAPYLETIGIHANSSPAFARVDGRAISACIINSALPSEWTFAIHSNSYDPIMSAEIIVKSL